MEFDNNLPIYIQIMDYIKRQIAVGELKEGEKLPSVRQMSMKLKVNPNTIQRSYQELEREDLLYTQRGMGTFVKEDSTLISKVKSDMAANLIKDFIEDMKSLGFTSQDITKLVNCKIEEGQ